MKRVFKIVAISLSIPLLGSAPQGTPANSSIASVIGMIWANERYVSCTFLTGCHKNITIVEKIPEAPCPFIGEVEITRQTKKVNEQIPLSDRLRNKYSITMKILYPHLTEAHKTVTKLVFHIYTNNSVVIREYIPRPRKETK